MRTPSDEASSLIAKARAGDGDARGALLERCQPRLLERIRFMLGDEVREQAESTDLVQSVLVAALEQGETSIYSDELRLLRWMTAVARNAIRDRSRRTRAQALDALAGSTLGFVPVDTSQPTPASILAQDERAALVAELVEELEPQERRVIELRELEGQTFAQIAAELGGTDDRIRLLHQRAILRLGRVCARRGL